MSDEHRDDPFRIERIDVRGYRSLLDVSVKLGPLNVLIGPNGVGKSSFLDVFALLGEPLGRREPFSRSLTRRGGLARVLTLGKAESLEISLVARLPAGPTILALAEAALREDQAWKAEKRPIGLTRVLEHSRASAHMAGGHGPLRYSIVLDRSGHGYGIRRETLEQDRGKAQPFYFIQREGAHVRVFDGKKLAEPDPAVPSDELILVDVPRAVRQAQAFREALGSSRLLGPAMVAPTAPLRSPQTLEPTTLAVAPDGANLFSVLYQLRHEASGWYERIIDVLKAAFRGFERLEFPVVAGGQVTLAWYDSSFAGKPFYANELSSGTLRFLTLVTTLLTPSPPPFLMFDEPEESLHPELIRLLAELLVEASERTQILVATQSPSLLKWIEREHLIVADIEDGLSRLTRASDMDIDKWLADYSLDNLWSMGTLGGRP